MSDIRKRIEKIERRLPQRRSEATKLAIYCHRVAMYLISFYLGSPGEFDSVITAYARGLGYTGVNGWREFDQAFRACDPEIDRRHDTAIRKVYEQQHVRLESEEGRQEDLKKLLSGLSASYQTRLLSVKRDIWRDP
jgi:hypothetical protein